MKKCRIGLVDDHPIILAGLKDLLQKTGRYDVVATGRTADDAVMIAKLHSPDLLFLGLQMSGDTQNSIRDITSRSTASRVLVFTASDRLEDCTEAMNNGAMGYVVKGSSGSELFQALEALNLGDEYVSPCLELKMMREAHKGRQPLKPCEDINLSYREDQIIAHLMKGASNKEIANQLEISEKTVKYYMTQIMQKFDVTSRLAVVIAAQKTGNWSADSSTF